MTTDQNKKFIEQMFNEVMNGKNLSLIDKYIASGFINHGFPNAKTGPAGFKEIVQQFLTAFPDMKINIEQVIAEGDTVMTRGYWTGTNQGSFMGMPSSGKKVRAEYIDIWKIKNDQCVENWVQMDMIGVMSQIGAMHANA